MLADHNEIIIEVLPIKPRNFVFIEAGAEVEQLMD